MRMPPTVLELILHCPGCVCVCLVGGVTATLQLFSSVPPRLSILCAPYHPSITSLHKTQPTVHTALKPKGEIVAKHADW